LLRVGIYYGAPALWFYHFVAQILLGTDSNNLVPKNKYNNCELS